MVLILISVMINGSEHFLCACWTFICLLWRTVHLVLLPAFLLYCSLSVEYLNSLYILGISPSFNFLMCKYFLLFSRKPF